MPAVLDPALFEKVGRLTKEYGRILCRMLNHVSRCNGCDVNDVVTAYHDVYRRHRVTVDYLAHFAQSIPVNGVADVRSKVEGVLEDENLVITEGASSLSAYSERWRLEGVDEGGYGVEVVTSLCSQTSGVNLYLEALNGLTDKLLNKAEAVAEEIELDWEPPSRLGRIVPVELYQYDKMVEVDVAAQFVKLYQFVDEVFKRMK
mgnify:FL=1